MYKRRKQQDIFALQAPSGLPKEFQSSLQAAFSKIILHMDQKDVINQIQYEQLANRILRQVQQQLEQLAEDRQKIQDDYIESPTQIAQHIFSHSQIDVSEHVKMLVLKAIEDGQFRINPSFDPIGFLIESLKR